MDDANDYGSQLTLGRTTAPISLWVLGAVLALAGVYYFLRKPPVPDTVPSPTEGADPE